MSDQSIIDKLLEFVKDRKQLGLGLLCLSITFFLLGLMNPLFSTTTEFIGLVMGHNKITLFSSVDFMWGRADYFLAILITLFTFVLPVVEYTDLLLKRFNIKITPAVVSRVLNTLDKWSMLDVFVVAQVIVVFKFSTKFVEIDLESGTVFLAMSIFLRMLAGYLIKYPNSRLVDQESDSSL